MRVLLLGAGMQGKAALHFLANSAAVSHVDVADADLAGLEEHVSRRGYDGVTTHPLDAAARSSIDHLMAGGVDVAIDLLPVAYLEEVAASAIAHRVHLVNAFFVSPGLAAMAQAAAEAGVTILPEFGLDPGIDLVLLGQALRGMEEVDEILTYGAGVPEPDAADNPLRYKVSWTFKGVLDSYARPGAVIEDGRLLEVPAVAMFDQANVHEVEIDGVGRLEAFPNGDITEYFAGIDLDTTSLRRAGRFTMRWPGHSAFWAKLSHLGLLSDGSVEVNGVGVDRREYLAAALEDQLAYGADERDIAIVRVEVAGTVAGRPERRVLEVVDRRDLETGIMAMGRTTGFTAAIGATMIGAGRITKAGLLSPLTDVPFDEFTGELERVGVEVKST